MYIDQIDSRLGALELKFEEMQESHYTSYLENRVKEAETAIEAAMGIMDAEQIERWPGGRTWLASPEFEFDLECYSNTGGNTNFNAPVKIGTLIIIEGSNLK